MTPCADQCIFENEVYACDLQRGHYGHHQSVPGWPEPTRVWRNSKGKAPRKRREPKAVPQLDGQLSIYDVLGAPDA